MVFQKKNWSDMLQTVKSFYASPTQPGLGPVRKLSLRRLNVSFEKKLEKIFNEMKLI